MPETIEQEPKLYHPVTHVLFDLDGTLLDTEPHFWKADSMICEKYGREYTMESKTLTMGRASRETAEILVKTLNLPITVDEFVEQSRNNYKENFANIDLMPGALKLIQHLHKHGIPQAIATSSTRFGYDYKARKQAGLFEEVFEHIMTGGTDPEVKAGKPAPDIFLIAAGRFKKKPKEIKDVLVFEDSPSGVQAAIAAGMQVVWVPDLRYVDGTTQSADLVIPSLEDFDPTLFSLPPLL